MARPPIPLGLAVLLCLATQAHAQPAAKAVEKTFGKAAPGRTGSDVIGTAKAAIEEKVEVVAHFVNEQGCAVVDGEASWVEREGVSALLERVGERTEVILASAAELQTLTGDAKARAAGFSKSIKGAMLQEKGVRLGDAGKHAIVIAVEPPPEGSTKGPRALAGSKEIAAQLLRIVLRHFGNPALGGGDKRADPSPAIVGLQSALTDHLGWTRGQGSEKWRVGMKKPPCEPESDEEEEGPRVDEPVEEAQPRNFEEEPLPEQDEED